METKKNQNQIVVTMNSENGKQKLPLNLIIPVIAGALAGTGIVLALLAGVKFLISLQFWFVMKAT